MVKQKTGVKANTLFTADNLYILNGMNSESVDLIYLDPPFNSKRMYEAPVGSKAAGSAFKDMWTWSDVDEAYLENLFTKYPFMAHFIQTVEEMHGEAMMSYLTYMAQRIIEMHRVLKSTGSFYLHCDPTASHYLKIILDRIFGKDNFRNEIVWCYKEQETATNYFPKKHDIIFFYTKTEDYIFNIQWQPHSEAQLKRYNIIKPDGRYANMKGKLRKLGKGSKFRDYWNIDIVQRNERTGYPTQKPLALLYRIIEASSKKGDVVFDPFCGCATTMVASQQKERKWIGIDIADKSVDLVAGRLESDSGLFTDFVHRKNIPKRSDIKEVEFTLDTKETLFKNQEGKCNGCYVVFEKRNLEQDHIVPRSKGGGDYFENYQLLCGSCNRTKGDRPMEYLRMKMKKINEAKNHKISFTQ